MNKIERLLKSRKFWAAVVAVIVSIFGARAGIDETQLTLAVIGLVTYILGVALEDGLQAKG